MLTNELNPKWCKTWARLGQVLLIDNLIVHPLNENGYIVYFFLYLISLEREMGTSLQKDVLTEPTHKSLFKIGLN
ncbi:hypothetical protein BpHYR1_014451 [Brachionus plicatilis]|uniref:Uncharacterized protein n=1 Tax=Brachionus plicatilis TaxID=10195 RepID=A0A3M7Q9G1_BRAPC|nr:hypothetical protein BpHYR1_014451 [Brachionus plicatilis]